MLHVGDDKVNDEIKAYNSYKPETKNLRDEFACFALMGMLARNCTTADDGKPEASLAYKYADAMMKERNRNDR